MEKSNLEKPENDNSEIKFIGEPEKLTIEQIGKSQLLSYANEHLDDYHSVWAPEVNQIYKQNKQNTREFNENVLPNVPIDILMAVDSFLAGYPDSKIIKLFKRFNFDYQQILDNKDFFIKAKREHLITAIIKFRGYGATVAENRELGIHFIGFEDDADFADATNFLLEKFGPEILHGCLISQILHKPEIVAVALNSAWYLLPLQVYKDWKTKNPEIVKYKLRAESTSNWNLGWSKKFMSTPILIYSFIDEHPENLNYLAQVPEEQKMRLYKLGTIAHEIGHSMYVLLLDVSKRQKWHQLVDRKVFSTEYSKQYAQENNEYEETFCEAIRLITTVPQYLETNFPTVYNFLINNFPDLKTRN